MNKVYCVFLSLLSAIPTCGRAQDQIHECPLQEITVHVLQQIEVYGPLSIEHEYFGFIYRLDGVIGTALTRSSKCHISGNCTVKTRKAAKLIPAGAKIFGEWHTHPHHGSRSLSTLDVRGAYYNRHIRCYSAFFSAPSGEIYLWDAKDASVQTAMASRVLIGNYRQHRVAMLP